MAMLERRMEMTLNARHVRRYAAEIPRTCPGYSLSSRAGGQNGTLQKAIEWGASGWVEIRGIL